MKFTLKSPNAQVRRTFACDDCNIEWTVWQERADPPPECPSCALAEARAAVTAPAILTNRSVAMKIAEANMESMGYTDFNTNQREGDVAYKAPSPTTTQEAEALIQQSAEMARELAVPPLSEAPQVPGGMSPAEMGRSFWKSGGGQAPIPDQAAAALVGMAQMNAGLTRREGYDPMALLHAKRPPLHLDVVAADTPQRVRR